MEPVIEFINKKDFRGEEYLTNRLIYDNNAANNEYAGDYYYLVNYYQYRPVIMPSGETIIKSGIYVEYKLSISYNIPKRLYRVSLCNRHGLHREYSDDCHYQIDRNRYKEIGYIELKKFDAFLKDFHDIISNNMTTTYRHHELRGMDYPIFHAIEEDILRDLNSLNYIKK